MVSWYKVLRLCLDSRSVGISTPMRIGSLWVLAQVHYLNGNSVIIIYILHQLVKLGNEDLGGEGFAFRYKKDE